MDTLTTSGSLKVTNDRWRLYVVRCSDDSLYTGITTDLERRVYEHNQGKGAKYTRARIPVHIIYFERHPDRSAASKAEAAFKKLTRKKKLEIINKWDCENSGV